MAIMVMVVQAPECTRELLQDVLASNEGSCRSVSLEPFASNSAAQVKMIIPEALERHL